MCGDVMEIKVQEYLSYLEQEEKSLSTRRQYQRDILDLLCYASGAALTKDIVIQYKEKLRENYKPSSVNVKIAAINSFFAFIGQEQLKVKQLRIQRRPYCPKEKELTKAEYWRLVEAAKQKKNERLSLLLQTLCGTGIRISELKFITVKAVQTGEAVIQMKGKTREILIAGRLQKALKAYIGQNGLLSGPVFITKGGRPLDRSNIWKMMKALCRSAQVDPHKVFPHNLRHLFARTFYSLDKDLAKLADLLGHSSINTTRIYIISSGQEHRKRLDALGLVL